MNDDHSQEEKQNYLRKNILDKGYDANEFINYIENKKGEEGKNIDNWKFESLIQTVEEFQSNFQTNQEKNKQIKNIEKNNNNQNNLEKKIIKENKNEIIIDCIKSEITDFTNCIECFVKLTVIEKKEGFFLSLPTILFEIETFPFHFKVKRKNIEFNLLKNILEKIYIGKIFSPILKFDKLDDICVNNVKNNFERFLNDLLFDDLIKNSNIIYQFLTNEEFDFVSLNENLNNVDELKNIKTKNGQIKISLDEKKDLLFENTKKNLNTQKNLIKKLNSAFISYDKKKADLQNDINEIIKLFTLLKENSEKNFELKSIIQIYDLFIKSFNILKTTTEQLNFENNIEMKNYFNYYYNHLKNYNNFIDSKINNSKSIYERSKENLNNLKEKHFKEKDISNWEIENINNYNKIHLLEDKNLAFKLMFPKKTKEVEYLKYFYKYYLNEFLNNYENLKINHIKELIYILKEFNFKNNDACGFYRIEISDYLNKIQSLPEFIYVKRKEQYII